MPTFFQTTNKSIDINFLVGTNAEHPTTVLKVDFGHDYENFNIPEAVVEQVKAWLDYQYANAESRAKLLLKGLLQYATNPM